MHSSETTRSDDRPSVEPTVDGRTPSAATPPKTPDRADWLQRMETLLQRPQDSWPVEFARVARAMLPHVHPSDFVAFAEAARRYLENPHGEPVEAAIEPLVHGQHLKVWTGRIRFQSRKSLAMLVEEILVRREYLFRSTDPSPYVIDAGANIGLATYFVKRMCKAGSVVCFEPNPGVHAILTENIAANRFADVTVHRAALAARDGEARFFFSEAAPLAGSLMPRREDADGVEEVVPLMRLSPFIDRPVGLLKLDIEGAEGEVLEECADRLHLVENLFCEVHPREGEVPSLLVRVLGVLERAGFMVHVARSPWSERVHRDRPLHFAATTYSLSVFATRIRPDGTRIG